MNWSWTDRVKDSPVIVSPMKVQVGLPPISKFVAADGLGICLPSSTQMISLPSSDLTRVWVPMEREVRAAVLEGEIVVTSARRRLDLTRRGVTACS